MALSDPFNSTYEGAFKAGTTLGTGIQSATKDITNSIAEKNKQKQAYNTLKAAGMIKENVTPPSDDELKKGLEDYAKQGGISQVNWMESDDPKETRNSLEGTYKALGIPLPKGKTTIDYNLAPGTKYKVNDNLVMEGQKKEKTIADQIAEYSMAQKMLGTAGLTPDGMEITGYDQKGKPMIRKKKEEKPPTAGQETTALYASRLKQSNDVFDKLENYINKQGISEATQGSLPDSLNFIKSADMQSYQQAQKNFLNAVLRRESGAVISPSEFQNGRQQYFPQPGDKPDVLAQKKANRDLVMKNFIASSKDAYVPYKESSGDFSSMSDDELRKIAGE